MCGQLTTSSAVSELSFGEHFTGVADDLLEPVLHLLEHTAYRRLVYISVQYKSSAVHRHCQDWRVGQSVLKGQ